LIVGNSGRSLDPLWSDKFSDGLTIFGNTGLNVHGYAQIDFLTDDSKRKVARVYLRGLENSKENAKVKEHLIVDIVQLSEKDQIASRKDLLNKNFKVNIFNEFLNKSE
jgi:hypothetical protein